MALFLCWQDAGINLQILSGQSQTSVVGCGLLACKLFVVPQNRPAWKVSES
jgi:hypothetical protein